MLDAEKEAFANTAFKRLYWTGYQGQFAAVSWPTGWFDKAAHCYGISNALLAKGHPQNYDDSEVVARLTGIHLKDWLKSQGEAHPTTSVHLIAHSMGNVVVSEALRHADGRIATTYVASQAAEVGGAYDSTLPDMQHDDFLYRGIHTAVDAWRIYVASVSISDYLMPPDIYRYMNMISKENGRYFVRHHQTMPAGTLAQEFGADAIPYYFANTGTIEGEVERISNTGTIEGKVGSIINFVNARDAALTSWEFNQLTKPDSNLSGAPEWGYDNAKTCGSNYYAYLDNSPCFEHPDRVESFFYRANVRIPWNPTMPLDGSDEQRNFAEILAHVVPARTDPLGQLNLPVRGITKRFVFGAFRDSNQGHSKQFYGYLSDGDSVGGYWRDVLRKGLNFDIDKLGLLHGFMPSITR